MASDGAGRTPTTLNETEPLPAGARPGPPSEEAAVREIATRQVERLHSFRLHVIAFIGGVIALGIIWMLTEYFQDNRWPTRLADSDDGDPGTWNPWLFYAIGAWAIVLGVHALKTYARRPPTEAEIQREIDRIESRR